MPSVGRPCPLPADPTPPPEPQRSGLDQSTASGGHDPSGIATMLTWYSLAVQLARLIPAPQKHAPVPLELRAARTRERFGRCPACGEFVGIKVATPVQRGLVCPACRETIVSLDPLWPTLSEARAASPGLDAKSARDPGSVARPGGHVSRAARRFGNVCRTALGFGPKSCDSVPPPLSPGVWDADLDA